MRDHIIAEIRRLAASSEQPPGQQRFERETGIAQHQWRGRYWARWGDALTEAGFQPNTWTGRGDPTELLSGIVAACRHFGRYPTNSELEMLRRANPLIPHPKSIQNLFGSRQDVLTAIARHVAADPALSDVAAMLPAQSGEASQSRPSPKNVVGFVYLIKSGDFYKIGRGDELEKRVKQIRVALPDASALIHAIRTDDPPGIEIYWHRRFDDKRANGEWFKLVPSDVAAFKKRNFM